MDEIIKKLKEYESTEKSRWREEANFRRKNKSWLRHSQFIAMLMLDKMEELGLTRQDIASEMHVSQQYVDRILKGGENISLETLAKIEDILHINILIPATDEADSLPV
ncbi:MAG: helix-turn-helix domain-containing protein [Prevotellaceae bacterium]|jgi:ribosome-binding protein aMBF1 (putative translation factor)|nr:helix-turn-helix domain-containing protein [Prevotellaceae bacterium]